jgi:hypothetical protein
MTGQGQQNQAQGSGCLLSIFRFIWNGILDLLGLGGRALRAGVLVPDEKFREYVDTWVAERMGLWLHETRSEIDAETATKVLNGQLDRYPEVALLIRETLIDAKVTFSQRDGKQYLEIEAYMAPRQLNGKQPQILRWKAEREIAWQEIPDDVREHLIRAREPVTLGYTIPER